MPSETRESGKEIWELTKEDRMAKFLQGERIRAGLVILAGLTMLFLLFSGTIGLT
jgi:hypothetical protein